MTGYSGIIEFATGTAAETPTTGYVALYCKSSDKKLYFKIDTGEEFLVGTPTGNNSWITAISTDVLENKRSKPRVNNINSHTQSSPNIITINSDNYDYFNITNITGNCVISVTGTPYDNEFIIFNIIDDGTTRNITFDTNKFEPSSLTTIPTSTVANELMTVTFMYSSITLKWRCVGVT